MTREKPLKRTITNKLAPLVLVVDDDRSTRLLISSSLKAMNVTTIEASNGEEALDLMENHPSLIILDVLMPGINGFETCKNIRLLPHGELVPILVITGLDDFKSIERAYEVGATDFINKPINFAQLRHRVRYLLRTTEIILDKRDSERRLLHAQRISKIAYWEWDLSNEKVVLSEQFEKLFGYKSVKDINEYLTWVHPQDRTRVEKAFRLGSANEASVVLDHRLILADGSERSVHVEADTVRDSFTGVKRFVGALQDITEQHELQKHLMHTERLVAVGQLAAGVAHEINNPASFLLANLQVIFEHMAELKAMSVELRGLSRIEEYRKVFDDYEFEWKLDESLQMMVDNVRGIERIVNIVRDLRAFSSHSPQNNEIINLRDIIDLACKISANAIRHNGEMEVEIEEDLPPIVGDAGKISQVLINLLINAGHAIAKTERESHKVSIRAFHEHDKLKIIIRDTGCGIPPSIQEKIFIPFFTTKSSKEGTGMGLALSADIIRQHRGSLTLLDSSSDGSSFIIELPPSETDAIQKTTANSTTTDQKIVTPRKLRILVVDDEPALLRAMKRGLSIHHKIVVASDGEEALEILKSDNNFDTIICDLMMPKIDGVDVFYELKEISPELAKKMIFCTGGAITNRTRDFRMSAKNKFFDKPVKISDLEEYLATEYASQ